MTHVCVIRWSICVSIVWRSSTKVWRGITKQESQRPDLCTFKQTLMTSFLVIMLFFSSLSHLFFSLFCFSSLLFCSLSPLLSFSLLLRSSTSLLFSFSTLLFPCCFSLMTSYVGLCSQRRAESLAEETAERTTRSLDREISALKAKPTRSAIEENKLMHL